MYAASFVLVIVALITLIIGVFQSGLTFIWVSIASSLAAALFLAVGVLQKKPVQPATAGAPYGPAAGTTETMTTERRAEPEERAAAEETAVVSPAPRRRAERPSAREEETAPAAPQRRKAAPRKTAPKKAPAKAAAGAEGAKAAPSKGAGTRAQVLAIPERGTYHVAGCRFVRGRRDTEKMTKTTASRRGYSPCGVCRP